MAGQMQSYYLFFISAFGFLIGPRLAGPYGGSRLAVGIRSSECAILGLPGPRRSIAPTTNKIDHRASNIAGKSPAQLKFSSSTHDPSACDDAISHLVNAARCSVKMPSFHICAGPNKWRSHRRSSVRYYKVVAVMSTIALTNCLRQSSTLRSRLGT
jgi:hypothetical protein